MRSEYLVYKKTLRFSPSTWMSNLVILPILYLLHNGAATYLILFPELAEAIVL